MTAEISSTPRSSAGVVGPDEQDDRVEVCDKLGELPLS